MNVKDSTAVFNADTIWDGGLAQQKDIGALDFNHGWVDFSPGSELCVET